MRYFNGGAYILEIDNSATARLFNWAEKGNAKINNASNPLAIAGITFDFYLIKTDVPRSTYFMTIEHNLLFNYAIPMIMSQLSILQNVN